MNKKKIAVGVAVLGAALVCASGLYVGTEASALLAGAEPAAVVDSSAATTEGGSDLSDEARKAQELVAARNATSTPTPSVPSISFDEQIASIPSDWPEDEITNATIWLEQAQIITECMDDAGFEYRYEPYWLRESGPFPPSLDPALSVSERAAADLALWGDTGAGADYHWEDAGCHGYAVHVTGQDNAH